MNVKPMLMFQSGTQDALDLYCDALPNTEVLSQKKREDGTLEQALLSIDGFEVMVLDSAIQHGFDFTPSMSLFVNFDDAQSLDQAFERLSQGGAVMMPLDRYDFAVRYAWLSDRFGVSWQLSLPLEG